MKNGLCLLFAVTLLCGAGCATMRTTHTFQDVKIDGGRTPLATIEIENTGWFLFDLIPIVCGDPKAPNENSCRWFTNTVTLQNNLEMLDRKMQTESAGEIANLTSRSTDDFYYFFLLYRRAYHTSASILRAKDQK